MYHLTIILIRIKVAVIPASPVCRRVNGTAMYICLCHGITDRQIRRAVEQGASSLGEVQMQLPVGGCCGRCEPAARKLIEEHCTRATACQAEREPAFA
jgi:bacterioferritin-associated ferredoxin